MANCFSKEVQVAIATVPWHMMDHAYGNAADAPQELSNLFSEDEVLSGNAYYDWMLSAVFHQYTLYSATPPVVHIVILMFKTMDLKTLLVSEENAAVLLLDWLASCSVSWQRNPEVAAELRMGWGIYEQFSQTDTQELKVIAQKLLAWCEKYDCHKAGLSPWGAFKLALRLRRYRRRFLQLEIA
jgi:hypothetical protein